MQEVLFYRELDFPLKRICEILSSSNYNKTEILQEQKQILIIKKERLERLISAIDDVKKGENIMKVFDNSKFERYKAEAQERWGNTDAYKEHTQKTKDYGKDKWNNLVIDMDIIFNEFALCMKNCNTPYTKETQKLVKKLQNHITENYYTCTNEILFGLGQMYVADERFKNNIDKRAEGTAAYVSEAIAYYCKK